MFQFPDTLFSQTKPVEGEEIKTANISPTVQVKLWPAVECGKEFPEIVVHGELARGMLFLQQGHHWGLVDFLTNGKVVFSSYKSHVEWRVIQDVPKLNFNLLPSGRCFVYHRLHIHIHTLFMQNDPFLGTEFAPIFSSAATNRESSLRSWGLI